MGLLRWIQCKLLEQHSGPVSEQRIVEIVQKKNKPPMFLKKMPIRQCVVCQEKFVSYHDLMDMGA